MNIQELVKNTQHLQCTGLSRFLLYEQFLDYYIEDACEFVDSCWDDLYCDAIRTPDGYQIY